MFIYLQLQNEFTTMNKIYVCCKERNLKSSVLLIVNQTDIPCNITQSKHDNHRVSSTCN